jgi:protein CrcB
MIHRRDWLKVAGISVLGLTVPELFRLRAQTAAAAPAARHNGNSCVFLFLFGGPSHIDLWDMKPQAPAEIRGDFTPTATSVPGIEICEHLPRLAQTIDKLCLLRSMTHRMNVHGPACSEVFSGREYFGPPVTDQARPEDWPSLSAMTMRHGRSPLGLPASVVLPWYLQFPGQSLRIAGQSGGRIAAHSLRMLRALIIGGFGFVGTLARYYLQGFVQRVSGGTFPYGTLAVNVLGSFLVGFAATLLLERAATSPLWRSAILIGFCGGFTTFSALAYETFELTRTGDPWRGALNMAAHAVLGLAAVWAGYATAVKV